MNQEHLQHHGQEHLAHCIVECNECADLCEHMLFQHCAPMGGEHTGQEHMRLMADCIAICRTAAGFMVRGSSRHAAACELCAQICEECANDCERVGEMEDCVEACRRCAESCRHMAATHA